MQFELRETVGAPLDRVEAALLSEDFFDRVGASPRIAAPVLLEEVEQGTVVLRRVAYRFTAGVTGAVRRVVDPEKMTWVDESHYDRTSHRATHEIVPDHYAKLLHCTYEEILEPDGDGCVRIAEGDLSVRVPLVGKRVERTIIDGIRERAKAEARVLAAMAAGR
jgi:hypothetical protein